ncbi:MAG: glycosyltransferase family 1 protein [Cyanobacteriota bacterium]|nr:glycosyltransferase family 1 protein [Cyanobacteriota bacterium]
MRRLLFLTEDREDYLADGLLHGLIHSPDLLVVDHPRKRALYRDGLQPGAIGVRGGGFTLYGQLEDRDVDRSFVPQRLERGAFDLVVLGQVWRQWGQLLDVAPWLQSLPVVLLDGDDDARLFFRSGTRLRRYGWQPFPIRSRRCLYLKREWRGQGRWLRRPRVAAAGFSIPAAKIRRVDPAAKSREFATHCVDAEVASALGLPSAHAFTSEEAYYDDLSRSRFAITTRRGGWDCLRHYEIAAAGAVPCFRNLQAKPPTCAPHGLRAGLNCLSYRDWPDLREQVARITPEGYAQLLWGAQAWVAHHTTTAAAWRLLHQVDAL